MHKPPSLKKLTEMVDAWNARFPVGTPVKVTKDDRSVIETTTTSEASVMGGHSAVIFLDGIRGCYDLARCRAL